MNMAAPAVMRSRYLFKKTPENAAKTLILPRKIAPYSQKRPVFKGCFSYLAMSYKDFSRSDPKNHPKNPTRQ
jgi:hypothetical protein